MHRCTCLLRWLHLFSLILLSQKTADAFNPSGARGGMHAFIQQKSRNMAPMCGNTDSEQCIQSFKLQSLCREKTVAEAFRQALHRDSVVVIEPGEKEEAAIAALAAFGAEFFSLDPEVQSSYAPLGEPEESEFHFDQSFPFGYWKSSYKTNDPHKMGWNLFLDTRLRRVRDAAATDSGLEVLPRSLEDVCPGCCSTLIEGQRVLFDMGARVLQMALAGLGGEMPDVQDLVDSPDGLQVGASSATVHRFAWYESELGDAEAADEKECVAFAAHTDGSWLTLIPCSSTPGLEVSTPAGWQSPEKGRSPGRVAVLTGDGLQFLSKSFYSAALHRVVQPPAGSPPRLSAPLLFRASPKYVKNFQENRNSTIGLELEHVKPLSSRVRSWAHDRFLGSNARGEVA